MRPAAIALLLLGLAGCGQPPGPQNSAGAPAPSPTGTGSVKADGPDTGNGPRERFIVCPGNPRCPPAGSQPKGQQPN